MTTNTTTLPSNASTAADPPRTTSEHGVLPLEPIDRPRGLFLRFLYWATKRRFGATPTAFRVVYARAPALAVGTLVLATVMDRFLKLPKEIRFLVQVSMATENGCTFCADLVLAEAIRSRIGKERFSDLAQFETSDQFDERTKAALAYGRAVCASLHVSDEVLERVRASFSEREMTELVWLCAVERYFNGMALPLRIGNDHLAP